MTNQQLPETNIPYGFRPRGISEYLYKKIIEGIDNYDEKHRKAYDYLFSISNDKLFSCLWNPVTSETSIPFIFRAADKKMKEINKDEYQANAIWFVRTSEDRTTFTESPVLSINACARVGKSAWFVTGTIDKEYLEYLKRIRKTFSFDIALAPTYWKGGEE